VAKPRDLVAPVGEVEALAESSRRVIDTGVLVR
jgi:hypothetical protein